MCRRLRGKRFRGRVCRGFRGRVCRDSYLVIFKVLSHLLT